MKCGRFTIPRRAVALSVLALFLLQLLRINWLVGGITGSAFLCRLNLIDLFAFGESAAAGRGLSLNLLYSVIPILIIYALAGRAFCGWVCPLDMIFRSGKRPASLRGNSARRGTTEAIPDTNEIAALPSVARNDPAGARGEGRERVKSGRSYLVILGFLIIAALFQTPFFTSYISPITNFYRIIYTAFFRSAGFPAEIWVLAVSGLVVLGFLLLDLVRPRLWCRSLCPVGKVYGLFNRIDSLHVEIADGPCKGCRACEEACYMGVKILPAVPRKIRDSSCILCGRCVDACRGRENILKMRFW